jgi:hypothetical protein
MEAAMSRRLILAALTLAIALVAFAPGRVAAAEWCDTDPLVVIQTPGGALVPVYVTSGALGVEHLPAVQLAAISYTTRSVAGGTATRVRIEVVVPDDIFAQQFPTRSVASTGPLGAGAIYDSTSGVSGQTMALTFTLAVP